MMALEKSSNIEQKIITGLIVSAEFVNLIQPGWEDWVPLLITEDYRPVARWCLDYFTNYKKVPGDFKDLDSIYTDQIRRQQLTVAEAQLIEKALLVISDKYEADGSTFYAQYQFDRAVRYFRQRKMEEGVSRVETLLERDEIEDATAVLAASLKPTIETDPASLVRGTAAEAIIAASAGDMDTARIAAFRAATVSSPVEKLPDPWGDPEPLPLDITMLPSILRYFVDIRARVIGSETSALAWSAIGACSASLPSSLRLQMKRNDPSFTVPPGIWLMLVGDPSSRKSPTLKVAFAPLHQIQSERYRKWEAEKREWDHADEKTRGPPPRFTQLITNDPTPEGIRDLLSGQDRGIIVYNDEWSRFIGAMGRYSAGRDAGAADRALWNIAYEGGSYASNRANRKGGERIIVPDLQATVAGGVQPDILRRFNRNNELTADGMLQRACPILMGKPSLGEDIDSEGISKRYELLIRRLVAVSGNRIIHLSPDAEVIRARIEERLLHYEQMDSLGRGFTTAAGKLHGIWGRLALTLAHLMAKRDERKELTEISGDAARLAEWLVFDSLIQNMERFYRQVLGSGETETTQAIAAFLLREQRARVTATDIVRHVHAVHSMKTDQVRDVVSPLVSMGWLTPEGDDERRARAWVVNPDIYTQFAEQAAQAKMQSEMARDVIAQSVLSRARNSKPRDGAMTFIARADANSKKGILDISIDKSSQFEDEASANLRRAHNKYHSSRFSLREKVLYNAMMSNTVRRDKNDQAEPLQDEII
jgi:hypothetical protein